MTKKSKKEWVLCDRCEWPYRPKSLYKLTWRYTDKTRKYSASKRFIIHTGYAWLCRTCLKEIINLT